MSGDIPSSYKTSILNSSTLNTFRRKFSPLSKRDLFICSNNCASTFTHSITNPDCLPCYQIQCNGCKSQWYICRNCPIQRTKISSIRKFKIHLSRSHRESINSENICIVTSETLAVSNSTNKRMKYFLSTFPRRESAIYFYYKQFNLGEAYLVSYAQFQLPNISHLVRDTDIILQLRLARMFQQLSPQNSDNLCNIFCSIINEYCDESMFTKIPWICKIPQTIQQARSLYKDGKYALIPNLPHPTIHKLSSHSFVYIEDIVKDFLFSGGDYLEVPPSSFYDNNLVQPCNPILLTNRCQEISYAIKTSDTFEDTIHLLLLRWSDDFEPSSSNKKNRSNGMWILTVSIMSEKNNGKHTKNTYVISMGRKGDDHNVIEDELSESVIKFNSNNEKWYSSPRHNYKKMKVRVHFFACLGDSPEKYTVCRITRGNGTYTCRWGHSIDIKQVKDSIPSCNKCRTNLLDICKNSGVIPIDTCNDCADWEFYSNGKSLFFEPPAKYPLNCAMLVDKKLFPRRINSSFLRKICDHAHNNMVNGLWTKAECESYLKVYGLNEDLRENIINNGDNIFLYNSIDSMTESNKKFYVNDRRKRPRQYEKYPLPKVWFHPMGIESFIDAPMHLLFLGVMKDVHRNTMAWCKQLNIESMSMRHFSAYFNSLFEMKLEWLKIIPIGEGSFSGWVSENWLAYARIMKWLYSIIGGTYQTKTESTIPKDIPQRRWLMKHNKEWLKKRGLNTAGSALELRERVATYMNDQNCPTELPKKHGGTLEHMKSYWYALHSLIANCMYLHPDTEIISETKVYIKIFLNSVHDLDRYLNDGNQKYCWYSSWNYITLLNVPETLKKFGSFQNLWEGATVGEGILKDVKPLSTYVYTNWSTSLTTKIYQDRTLKYIYAAKVHPKKQYKTKNLHIYNSISHVFEAWTEGQPISVVMTAQNECIAQVNTNICVQFVFDWDTSNVHFGHYYFEVVDTIIHQDNTYDCNHHTKFGIMLPLLKWCDERKSIVMSPKTYTIVFSDWTQIRGNGNITLSNKRDLYNYVAT